MSVRSLVQKISESSEDIQDNLSKTSDELQQLRNIQSGLLDLVGCFKLGSEQKTDP